MPVEEEVVPPVLSRPSAPSARAATPPAGSEAPAAPRPPELPAALAAPVGGAATGRPPVTQRSVLDSASHRFTGKPYRPSTGRVISLRMGHAAGAVVKGVAFLILGLWAGVRRCGSLLARAGGALVHGASAGGRRVGASVGHGSRALGRLPWVRILRIALPIGIALLALWGIVAGVRSCVREPASDAPLPPELANTAVLERVLPPPAGYAD